MNTYEHISEKIQVDLTSTQWKFLMILLKHVRDENELQELYQQHLNDIIDKLEFKRKVIRQRL
jgi:DNA-binding MarR family transcriptional regulator